MKRRTALALMTVTVLATMGLGGCSKKPPPKPDPTKVSGTWTEIAETDSGAAGRGSTRRIQPPPRQYLRQITLNDDKTFKMVLMDKVGKPVAGKAVEGTWEFQDNNLNFTVKTNTLDQSMQNWKPVSSSGVSPQYNNDRTSFEERLMISHEDFPVTYKRGTGG